MFKISPPKLQSKFWLLVLPLALIATLLAWLFFRHPLEIVSTTPPDQTHNVALFSPISITFSQALNPDHLPEVALDPQIDGQTTLSDDHLTLTFTPNYSYLEATSYKVTVTAPNLNYSFSFTTISPPMPRPAPSIIPQLQQLKDQLIGQLPAQFPGYTISYDPKLDLFHINIQNEPVDYLKAQALDFFKRYGFDDPVHQLKIFFNVPRALRPPLPGSPTLTPTPIVQAPSSPAPSPTSSPSASPTNPFLGP